MNLYNIYDAETELCLGKNKTAVQISNLFGIKQESVYRSAVSGDIISGKYRVELMEENTQGNADCDKRRMLSEWDEVVEPIREYFRRAREIE